MLFSLSSDSKLHTHVGRDRERDGVTWEETIFCTDRTEGVGARTNRVREGEVEGNRRPALVVGGAPTGEGEEGGAGTCAGATAAGRPAAMTMRWTSVWSLLGGDGMDGGIRVVGTQEGAQPIGACVQR